MSTRKIRKTGKALYKRTKDVQNLLYNCNEDKPNQIAIEELPKTKGWISKKTLENIICTESEESREVLICIDGTEHQRQELKRDNKCRREKEAISRWCENRSPIPNKLNNSKSSPQQKNKRKSFFTYFEGKSEKLRSSENSKNLVVSKVLKNGNNEDREVIFALGGDKRSFLSSNRKRTSPTEISGIGFSKRLKVKLDKEMADTGVAEAVKVEQEIENSRLNDPFKRRNINTILDELELLSRRWKEGSSRFTSNRWGTSIIKTCSGKWDSHYIPLKVFQNYQKRMEAGLSSGSRNLESKNDRGISQVNYEVVEAKGTRIESEKVDEEAAEAIDYNNFPKYPGDSSQSDDHLNAFNVDVQEKMTLRSRNQNRNRPDEKIQIESGSEAFTKEKTSKKASIKSNKDYKKLINSNRQLVIELERCTDFQSKYQNEEPLDSNKNFEKLKIDELGNSAASQLSSTKPHYEEKANQGAMRTNDEDHVACPICEKKFEKHRIETHANHCATETFHD